MAADTASAAITTEKLRQLLHIQTELREQAENVPAQSAARFGWAVGGLRSRRS